MAEDRFSKETYQLAALAAQFLITKPEELMDEALKSAIILLERAERALAEDL